MRTLGEHVPAVERRRKTLEVYTDDESTVRDLAAQFATRNVEVVQCPYATGRDSEFVVVRDGDGEFAGALGLAALRQLLSPETHPPWEPGEPDDVREAFDFLDNTLFSSFDRRQMLAVTREIEGRTWRVGRGRLFVGFQNAAAFDAQQPVYERFAAETDVTVTVFVADRPDATVDGGTSEYATCGLVAEERGYGQFHGFWTYQPSVVGDVIAGLQATYLSE